MSYTFEFVRLAPGVEPDLAYRETLKEEEPAPDEDPGPLDPSKEEAKQRLAAALMARHPSLERFHPEYSYIAQTRSIDESEARRLFRNVELNEPRLSIQIVLFDNAGGASFSFAGEARECTRALHVLWDCLEIVQSHGGFST